MRPIRSLPKEYFDGTPFNDAIKYLPIIQKVTSSATETPIKSTGGPSGYYDFPAGATTLNDVMEYLAAKRWLGDALHLKDIFKAAWRWGSKEGTTKPYDARKIIYSAARLLMMYAGIEETRKTLQDMLDDKQFQVKGAN